MQNNTQKTPKKACSLFHSLKILTKQISDMIKHIVMWKLKEEAHGNDKATNAKLIKEKLEDLNGKIEGLLKAEVGIDVLGNGNFDVVLYSEVVSLEALDFYQKHPLHQAVLPFIREAVSERKAVDFEA